MIASQQQYGVLINQIEDLRVANKEVEAQSLAPTILDLQETIKAES